MKHSINQRLVQHYIIILIVVITVKIFIEYLGHSKVPKLLSEEPVRDLMIQAMTWYVLHTKAYINTHADII